MKEPKWLTVALVRVMHAELIAEHGGEQGLRDAGLLESALERARIAWAYGEHDLCVLAARYGHGLSSNHSFLDGNKRIALAAIDVFLRLNGMQLNAPEEDAYLTIMDLAGGSLSQDSLADWVSSHSFALD